MTESVTPVPTDESSEVVSTTHLNILDRIEVYAAENPAATEYWIRDEAIAAELLIALAASLKLAIAEIKDDPALRIIPVVVLTSSYAEQDILRSYHHHANCYVTKPVELEQFISVVKTIEDFWLAIVKLPKPMAVPR